MRTRNIDRREFIATAGYAGVGVVVEGLLPRTLIGGRGGSEPAGAVLKARVAATPTFRYRPYRSKTTAAAEAVSWVQVDLGQPRAIEAVDLHPANQRLWRGKDEYYTGEGFPIRFKIEASGDPEFARPVTIADYTGEDFENPRDHVVHFPAAGLRARYVRLTVTKLAKIECAPPAEDLPEAWPACSSEGDFGFAVSKISIVAEGGDAALGRPVTVDQALGNSKDAAQLTRANRIDLEYIYRDRPDRVTDPSLWHRTTEAAHAPKTGVTLHGGLFEVAMRNNIEYLLESFTLDDLLLQFRLRAGKPLPPSSRKPDPFWEQDLAGSNAGRFLMGAGNTLRWIDDAELRGRFEAVVAGIAECQQPNGYVMAYPEDTIFYSERGAYTRAWLTHGLIEAGYAGNQKAFEMLRANYDWFNQCSYLPELLRGAVQGGQGMIANTRLYFTPVGKPADIQVIQRYFMEDSWLEALARGDKDAIWQYPYDRPHCYLLTNLEAYLDVYRATGDKRWFDGVKAAWEMYHQNWEQPGGSISIIEYSYDPPGSNLLTKKLGELCGSVFWTFLSQRFQMLSPEEERYATEIEKSIYNVAIANQDGKNGMRYHTILVGNKEKPYRINTCCEGQGTRLLGSLPEHIYSIGDDGVFVNLFEPSTIAWKQGQALVRVHMETRFPLYPQVKLTVSVDRPTTMKLRVRVPSWAVRAMPVNVNGATQASGRPGTYITLDRTWREGDAVTFLLPVGFKLVEYTGADQIAGHKRYSLSYGPLLYAAVGAKDARLRLPQGSRPQDFLSHLKARPDAPLRFEVDGNPQIIYMPYYQVGAEEFTCFPVLEP